MKKSIPILLCMVMLVASFGVIATDSVPVEQSGSGTVTISNVAPGLDSIAINDGAWINSIDVATEYDFYVNVSDSNAINDIKTVVLEMWVPANEGADDPTYRYKFTYTETLTGDGALAGAWVQNFPTTENYLDVTTASTLPGDSALTTGSYMFSLTLNKTAKSGAWRYNATVIDESGAKSEIPFENFAIYKFTEMTYDTGAGFDFAWTSSAGQTDVATTFDTTITTNSGYTLAAAYEDSFYGDDPATTWWGSEPSLEIKTGSGSKTALTNYTASFADWTTFLGPAYEQVVTHTLYLDVPIGLPSASYTGVTIYIRASV